MSEVRLVRSQSPHDAAGVRPLSHHAPMPRRAGSSAGYRCQTDRGLSTAFDKSSTRQRVQPPLSCSGSRWEVACIRLAYPASLEVNLSTPALVTHTGRLGAIVAVDSCSSRRRKAQRRCCKVRVVIVSGSSCNLSCTAANRETETPTWLIRSWNMSGLDVFRISASPLPEDFYSTHTELDLLLSHQPRTLNHQRKASPDGRLSSGHHASALP
jgi:hypothetical protein